MFTSTSRPPRDFDREGDEVAGGGPVGDVVTAGHGTAAAGPDLGADGFGPADIGTVAADARAEVVDDDACPVGRQGERVGPADAVASARHNRNASGQGLERQPLLAGAFKTVKYLTGFPGQSGCIEGAKDFCRKFFQWYNTEHRHGGIGLAHAPAGPLRPRPRGDRAPAERARRSLRRPPRPLRLRPAASCETPGRGLDQPRTLRHGSR